MARAPAFDVIHPSGERTSIPIDPLPFRIGRGPENNLILRDNRASRAHASIVQRDGAFVIEDLGSLHGTWVNGKRIEEPTELHSGDTVQFGFEDSYRLVFSASDARIRRILEKIDSVSTQAAGPAGSFARLRALVEVARTLQSSLAADEVLNAVVDTALALTGAERGFLLLRQDDELAIKTGRNAQGASLAASDLQAPARLIHRALSERRDLLSMTLGEESSESEFPNVICVPLVQFRNVSAEETLSISSQTNTVGLLYLDSRKRQTPLSELNRELLRNLALEASTLLENANLLEEERQKRRLEQEIDFARGVQQSLLPREFPETGWLRAAGSSIPSAQVAGDYFDVHAIGADCWAAIIADVSGKGISSALLAALLQGAFLLGSELDAPLDASLAKMNHFLIQRAQREKYATLFYIRIQRSGDAEWVNAGHCEPFVLSASGEIRQLESTGPPLGLVQDPEFRVGRMQLQTGDRIVAYSDGLPEARNDAEELFENELDAALRVLGPMDARQIHDELLEKVTQFRGDASLRDDITVLVLEYGG